MALSLHTQSLDDLNLPLIDLSAFDRKDSDARRSLAERIDSVCRSHGFFYLTGHGIAAETIAAVRAAAESFFARPLDEKMQVARPRGRYRGYIAPMVFARNPGERPPVRYEAFLSGPEVLEADPVVRDSDGLVAPNRWPVAPESFRPAVQAYYEAVTRVSDRLLMAAALALGQPEDSLLRHFGRRMTNISFLHYFARPGLQGRDDVKGHKDTNALTILLPSPVGGLEVLSPEGEWKPVDPIPGAFVVNIGDMMEVWSGGRWRSTMHRVHPPLEQERYSIGYFAVPDYDTEIEPLPGLAGGENFPVLHAGKDLRAFVDGFDRD